MMILNQINSIISIAGSHYFISLLLKKKDVWPQQVDFIISPEYSYFSHCFLRCNNSFAKNSAKMNDNFHRRTSGTCQLIYLSAKFACLDLKLQNRKHFPVQHH